MESLATIGIMALSTILTPFMGQNLGPRNIQRVEETLRLEDRYGDYLRTEIFQFNSKKFDKSVASNISNEDLIG